MIQPRADSSERKTVTELATCIQAAELALGPQSLAQLSEPLPSGQPTLHRLELLAAEACRWNDSF
jgi:hypothetical protein